MDTHRTSATHWLMLADRWRPSSSWFLDARSIGRPAHPERVVVAGGEPLLTRDDILTGQQSGSPPRPAARIGLGPRRISGAGLVGRLAARESLALLTVARREHGAAYAELGAEAQPGCAPPGARAARQHVRQRDRQRDHLGRRASAVAQCGALRRAFGGDPPCGGCASRMHAGAGRAGRAATRQAAAFFFWTSWPPRPSACEGHLHQQLPHEPLIATVPRRERAVVGVSVVLLLAGIGALVWWQAFRSRPRSNRSRRHDLRDIAHALHARVANNVASCALFAYRCCWAS